MTTYEIESIIRNGNEYKFWWGGGWMKMYKFKYTAVWGWWWGSWYSGNGWWWWAVIIWEDTIIWTREVCITSIWLWWTWNNSWEATTPGCLTRMSYSGCDIIARWAYNTSNTQAWKSWNWCAWWTCGSYKWWWGWWAGGAWWNPFNYPVKWWAWWCWVCWFGWWGWWAVLCNGCENCWWAWIDWWGSWCKDSCNATNYWWWGGGWRTWYYCPWNWCQWVVDICYLSNWDRWINSATWGDCCFACDWYCVHRFTTSGTFCITW